MNNLNNMNTCTSRIRPADSPSLALFNCLADCALAHAGDGLVSETDAHPSLEFLYTETHLALLLFLLNRAGVRRDGLSEAAGRLRAWDLLQLHPKFFNSMAITLLGLTMRESNVPDEELANALASVLARRRDFTDAAWRRQCGNNMYLQQLVTDVLLAPLADRRPLVDDASERLDSAFASCMSTEGYFFDLPRPGVVAQREFPFTYNLKVLFLLAICCRYLPDASLERRLRASLEATLPLFTREGDCSYFGRTDRSTFAAGLAVFCLRAAAARGIGGQSVCGLAMRAERMFIEFPVGEDGCLEVNRYPLPASAADRVLSRDDYAYRWQYAIAGAAYCLLGRHLFPFPEVATESGTADAGRVVFSSADLGVVRAQAGDMDLFIRTGCNLAAADRRHGGPTILRLENGGGIVVGTIPIKMSTDSRITVAWRGRSVAARHFDLLRYRWRHGFEHLQWELAGFLPVLRRRHRAWIPMQAAENQIDGNRLVTVHGFQGVHASGWVPTWNHFAYLAVMHVPEVMKSMFRERPLLNGEVAVQLTRTIRWTMDSVSIADQITGEIAGKELVVGTRLLNNCKVRADGLSLGKRLRGWSSDGLQEIQLYGTSCSGTECRYEIILDL